MIETEKVAVVSEMRSGQESRSWPMMEIVVRRDVLMWHAPGEVGRGQDGGVWWQYEGGMEAGAGLVSAGGQDGGRSAREKEGVGGARKS
eukprot:1706787-Prymnesium_polylepis.1